MEYDVFLSRLHGVHREPNGQAIARCPAHDDQRASLSVGHGDGGRILVRCHAGCEATQIVAAMGLRMADLMPSTNGNGEQKRPHRLGQEVAHYDYCDAAGDLIYQVVRFDPKDFRPRRPDGKGDWLWNLTDTPRILYRLRDIIDADPREWVFVVEGEKDADNLAALGLIATTNPGGAGKWSKLADDSALRGRRVAIIPDADEPGRKHARDVAARLVGKAVEIKIVPLPGAKKDASDWILAGGTAEQLVALAVAAARQAEDLSEIHNTDLGNSIRFVARYGPMLRCTDTHGWLIWNGRCWERDTTDNVEVLAKECVRQMYRDAADEVDPMRREGLASWAARCEARKRITDMIALARSDPAVRISAKTLDSKPFYITAMNGTIDLHTGQLRGHDQADLITMCAPVEYDEAAEAPLFHEFLREIMADDEEMIAFLQRAIGHSLTGDTSERCLFILWGSGRNGKSTLLHVIRTMLGDYALHARSETILAKHGDSVPCDLARLKGARFVTFSEVDEGRRMFVSRMKEMTGGTDPITARFMRENEFTFMPEFKPWIATNHKPAIHDDSDAIWDRLYTIPFTVRIPDDRVDKQLSEKLIAEHAGIFRWAVEGCLLWQRAGGLLPPEKVRAANDSYRTEMDTFAQWIEEKCEIGLDILDARGGELWDAYRAWCETNLLRPLGSRKFAERLAERFKKTASSDGCRVYTGIRLKSCYGSAGASGASGALSG